MPNTVRSHVIRIRANFIIAGLDPAIQSQTQLRTWLLGSRVKPGYDKSDRSSQ
jgi:hypothetical protein